MNENENKNKNNGFGGNNNFKKKIDYKLFFEISFIVNLLLLVLLYFIFTIPLDSRVKDLYLQNQNTYKQLITIKTVLGNLK